jgi:hypothetical protein
MSQQSSRTFRIFVSSAFSDLKTDRNALQEKVFPRLRDLAAAHGCRFQTIDMRWGVSEEATLDQQTMKICLGEIERCQKIFLSGNLLFKNIFAQEQFVIRLIRSLVPNHLLSLAKFLSHHNHGAILQRLPQMHGLDIFTPCVKSVSVRASFTLRVQ